MVLNSRTRWIASLTIWEAVHDMLARGILFVHVIHDGRQ